MTLPRLGNCGNGDDCGGLFVSGGITFLSIESNHRRIVLETNAGATVQDSAAQLVYVSDACGAMRRGFWLEFSVSAEVAFWSGKYKSDRDQNGLIHHGIPAIR